MSALHKTSFAGRVGGHKNRRTRVKLLDITSLIDILTILLVFLMKNVSMEVSKVDVPDELKLPITAQNEQEMLNELLTNGDTIVVRIFPDVIRYGINSTIAGTPNDLLTNTVEKAALVTQLKNDAKLLRDKEKNPIVLLQADKTIKCIYISAFMQMLAADNADIGDVYFATIKGDENIDYLQARR